MFSITSDKMLLLIKTMLDEGLMTQTDHDIFETLVPKIELHNILDLFNQTASPTYFDDSQMMVLIYTSTKAGVRSEVAEQLCLKAISSYLAETKDISTADFTEVLGYAIQCRFHRLANFLLDTNICMKDNYLLGPNNDSITTLVLLKNFYDQTLFDKILPREQRINIINLDGYNALRMAMANSNEYAIKKLLSRPDLILQHRFTHLRLIDNLYVPAAHIALIRERIKDPDFSIPDPKDELYEFPITWLSPSNQNRLRLFVNESIASLAVFKDLKLKIAFENFLNADEDLLFANMSRLSIALDCILYLKNPALIHQNTSNLCGVACVMQHLVLAHPARFVYTVIDIAQLHRQKPRYLPERLKTHPDSVINHAYHLAELWLQTVRNAYNEVLGYDASSKLEMLAGLTRPHHMALIYKDFGFKVAKETSQIRLSPLSRTAQFFDTARRLVSTHGTMPHSLKVYSKHHEELQCDDQRFDDLCNIAATSKYVTILVSAALVNKLLNMHLTTSLFNFIEASHYVTLSEFTYYQDSDTVSFRYRTYGKIFNVHDFPAKEFKREFLGLFSLDYDQANPLIPHANLELIQLLQAYIQRVAALTQDRGIQFSFDAARLNAEEMTNIKATYSLACHLHTLLHDSDIPLHEIFDDQFMSRHRKANGATSTIHSTEMLKIIERARELCGISHIEGLVRK